MRNDWVDCKDESKANCKSQSGMAVTSLEIGFVISQCLGQ